MIKKNTVSEYFDRKKLQKHVILIVNILIEKKTLKIRRQNNRK